MDPIDPSLDNLAPDWRTVRYAEGQPQYRVLPAIAHVIRDITGAISHVNEVVSIWEPTDDEAEELFLRLTAWKQRPRGGELAYRRGRDFDKPVITVTMLTCGEPLTPLMLDVGSPGAPIYVPYTTRKGETFASPPGGFPSGTAQPGPRATANDDARD